MYILLPQNLRVSKKSNTFADGNTKKLVFEPRPHREAKVFFMVLDF